MTPFPAAFRIQDIPDSGYDKKNQAGDIRALLAALGIEHSLVIGHDIGTMVAFAFAYATRYPQLTDRLVMMDAPVLGIPPWYDIVRSPMLWYFDFDFDFGGADAERLVAGRERIYPDQFWNEFAGDPIKVEEPARQHYAKLYARPRAMRAAFAQLRCIRQDATEYPTDLS
ncbi:alpha/beta fold hydrolase [Pseudomonas svalbardensis]|uniref:alpha/beta fold hydrolase n=1 Tax=Pseudomonas svalbardensis TaxID=3042029 RepID=UPI0024B3AB62|nr:alpha/beta fold hydrolase [Pseudomonas sp. PMCC200367]